MRSDAVKTPIIYKFDRGYIHQGCLGWGGNVAGTAVSRTRVAVQSQGPGNTHREVTYLSWAAPPYACVCGCVLAMQTNGLLYLIPTPTPTPATLMDLVFHVNLPGNLPLSVSTGLLSCRLYPSTSNVLLGVNYRQTHFSFLCHPSYCRYFTRIQSTSL